MRIPKRLETNPLLEVVAEIRFASKIPAEAIVGLVYGEVREMFGPPAALPLLQLPQALRDSDPNLRYGATHRFDGTGHNLLLGPRSVALSTPPPYKDWDTVSPILQDLLRKLDKLELFDAVERTGLRYVNFFEKINILDHATLTLEVSRKSIADHNIAIRSEKKEGKVTTVFQMINNAATMVAPPRTGSIFDIDIICEPIDGLTPGRMAEKLYEVLTESNEIADQTFFGLLKPDFVQQFKPTY